MNFLSDYWDYMREHPFLGVFLTVGVFNALVTLIRGREPPPQQIVLGERPPRVPRNSGLPTLSNTTEAVRPEPPPRLETQGGGSPFAVRFHLLSDEEITTAINNRYGGGNTQAQPPVPPPQSQLDRLLAAEDSPKEEERPEGLQGPSH